MIVTIHHDTLLGYDSKLNIDFEKHKKAKQSIRSWVPKQLMHTVVRILGTIK